ncbi:HesB/IscA family protein [Motiliproteus sediminis]|uniref:HesB/IscA family protein n=1 Tax=Motiliproteus sediminis TaxID=1468178 RepID=UPI001AEF7AA4|nr:iron-sulfur cluster assembly accessory protein [Motiliproteus sediminis]
MISLTDNARKAVRRFIQGADGDANALRLRITGGGCSGLAYEMSLEAAPAADDLVVDAGRFSVLIDPASQPLLAGVTVDFVDALSGSGFTFSNPNAGSECSCGKSFTA